MKEGARFSQNYLHLGTPVRDSPRIRTRVSAFYSHLLSMLNKEIGAKIIQEIGASVPIRNGSYAMSNFWEACELRDFLDAITVSYHVANESFPSAASSWKLAVSRVFVEENAGYLLDALGGIHYAVDEHFEHSRSATIAVLALPRYKSVLEAFEDAHRHFDGVPMDTKAAVRSAFESLEILVRLMIGGKNLNRIAVDTLFDKCKSAWGVDQTACNVASKLFKGIGEWVDGVHFYRHGQGTSEPVAPNEAMATHIVSTAADHIRWIAQIDALLQTASTSSPE